MKDTSRICKVYPEISHLPSLLFYVVHSVVHLCIHPCVCSPISTKSSVFFDGFLVCAAIGLSSILGAWGEDWDAENKTLHTSIRLGNGKGMSASCKPWVQLVADVGNGWPHIVVCCSIISSCQSATTSEIAKHFWWHTIDMCKYWHSASYFVVLVYFYCRLSDIRVVVLQEVRHVLHRTVHNHVSVSTAWRCRAWSSRHRWTGASTARTHRARYIVGSWSLLSLLFSWIGGYPSMLVASGCARLLESSRRHLMPVMSYRGADFLWRNLGTPPPFSP